MGNVVMIGQLLLALAILIILHEMGHFLVARMFGIKVEKFYLFFDAWGIKLFKIKRGDTEYGIGWLPLGGYVKIAGMVDESLDKEAMNAPPQPWEFRAKPAWQRFFVMIGGVTVNFLLGILIYSLMLFYYGEKEIAMEEVNKNGIAAWSFGQKMGFKSGDKIIAVNGKKPVYYSDVFSSDLLLKDKNNITINRDGKDTIINLPVNFADQLVEAKDDGFIDARTSFTIERVSIGTGAYKAKLEAGDSITAVDSLPVLFYDEFKNYLTEHKNKEVLFSIVRKGNAFTQKVQVDETGRIGFIAGQNILKYRITRKHYPLGSSFVTGTSKSIDLLVKNVQGLGRVVTGKVKAKNALSGPIAMATMFGTSWNWENFWVLTAMISLVLAFMNLLPIPALDGGHVVFLTYEMIAGRPVSEKVMYVAQVIGMALLLALMVFVFWNDIARLIR